MARNRKDSKKKFKNKQKPKKDTVKAKRGYTFQTRDEYFAGQRGKNIKPNHPNKDDLYRTGIILKVNEQNEFLVVPTTTKKKIQLDDYYDKKTHAKDVYEIFDCDGNPIKQSQKFKINADKKKNISERDLEKIEKYCLEKSKRKQRNQKQLNKFNNRYKK